MGHKEIFQLRVMRLDSNPDLDLPVRATPQAAGYDVRSSDPDFELRPGEIQAVGTGLALAVSNLTEYLKSLI